MYLFQVIARYSFHHFITSVFQYFTFILLRSYSNRNNGTPSFTPHRHYPAEGIVPGYVSFEHPSCLDGGPAYLINRWHSYSPPNLCGKKGRRGCCESFSQPDEPFASLNSVTKRSTSSINLAVALSHQQKARDNRGTATGAKLTALQRKVRSHTSCSLFRAHSRWMKLKHLPQSTRKLLVSWERQSGGSSCSTKST